MVGSQPDSTKPDQQVESHKCQSRLIQGADSYRRKTETTACKHLKVPKAHKEFKMKSNGLFHGEPNSSTDLANHRRTTSTTTPHRCQLMQLRKFNQKQSSRSQGPRLSLRKRLLKRWRLASRTRKKLLRHQKSQKSPI